MLHTCHSLQPFKILIKSKITAKKIILVADANHCFYRYANKTAHLYKMSLIHILFIKLLLYWIRSWPEVLLTSSAVFPCKTQILTNNQHRNKPKWDYCSFSIRDFIFPHNMKKDSSFRRRCLVSWWWSGVCAGDAVPCGAEGTWSWSPAGNSQTQNVLFKCRTHKFQTVRTSQN